ncbi:T9SS type A sorting domain-containing protein, partial [Moheibacter sediminis]
FGQWDVLVSATKSEDNTYLLGGYASTETLGRKTDNKGINDYIALKINHKGEMLWSKTIGGKDTDQLKGLTQTRDGGYILAGNSDSKKSDDKDRASIGGNDFWVVKLGEKNRQDEQRQLVEIYPNPTNQYTNIVISESYTTAKVEVFDMVGRKLQSKDLPYRTTPIDLQGYPPGVYIFKITIDGAVNDVKVIKKGNK